MENIKSSYINSKFKISAPTRNDKFELPHGSYSVSNITSSIFQKSMENNPSVQLYVKKLKIGLYLKLKIDVLLNFKHLKQ